MKKRKWISFFIGFIIGIFFTVIMLPVIYKSIVIISEKMEIRYDKKHGLVAK